SVTQDQQTGQRRYIMGPVQLYYVDRLWGMQAQGATGGQRYVPKNCADNVGTSLRHAGYAGAQDSPARLVRFIGSPALSMNLMEPAKPRAARGDAAGRRSLVHTWLAW